MFENPLGESGISENRPRQLKKKIILLILLLAFAGELFLVLLHLIGNGAVFNNLVVIGCIVVSLAALKKDRMVVAQYTLLLSFSIDFLRAYYSGGGVLSRSFPVVFLLIVLGIYLLDLRQATIFLVALIVAINLDIPLRISERFTTGFVLNYSGGYMKQFIIADITMIVISVIFSVVFYQIKKYIRALAAHKNDWKN